MQISESIQTMLNDNKAYCCNQCENWGHISSFHEVQTECLFCWLKDIHIREIDIHTLLHKNYYWFELILDRLWDRFYDIIDSFSFFGVKFRCTGDKWTARSRIDWFDDMRWWDSVPFELEIQIKDWMYITWSDARTIIAENYKEKA